MNEEKSIFVKLYLFLKKKSLAIVAILTPLAFYFSFFNEITDAYNKFKNEEPTSPLIVKEYVNYYIGRFDFGFKYPKNWELGREPDNGDGIVVYNPTDSLAEIRVYGSHFFEDNYLSEESLKEIQTPDFFDFVREEEYYLEQIQNKNRNEYREGDSEYSDEINKKLISQKMFYRLFGAFDNYPFVKEISEYNIKNRDGKMKRVSFYTYYENKNKDRYELTAMVSFPSEQEAKYLELIENIKLSIYTKD